jgi:hypothetical protein
MVFTVILSALHSEFLSSIKPGEANHAQRREIKKVKFTRKTSPVQTKVTKQKMTVASLHFVIRLFSWPHNCQPRLKPPDELATKGTSPVIFSLNGRQRLP